MKERTRDISTYILVNLILLLIATFLIGFIIIQYNPNKKQIKNVGIETNIIAASTQGTKKEENPNTQIVTPNIVDYNTPQGNTEKKTVYKYYYNQLDNESKKIYDEIEKNIENLKTGTYTIKLPNNIAKVLENANGTAILSNQFQSAWDAIIMDRVDLFYIDISKVELKIKTIKYGSKTEYYLSIGPNDSQGSYLENGFQNEKIVNMALSQVENTRNQIVSQLTGDTYNKILQVHDWLVENLEYGTEISGANSYNIYGALINKSVVCEGYAEAFKYIMDELNIPCILIVGEAQNSEGTIESHEWNYVKIDKNWYGVDVTWDDPIILSGYATNTMKHKYFLKGSNTMNKNHYENGKVSSKGIEFKYPTLTEQDYIK